MSYSLSILPGNPILPSGLSIAFRVNLETSDASGRVIDVKDVPDAVLTAEPNPGVTVSIAPGTHVVQASWTIPATPGSTLPSVIIQASYRSPDGSIVAQGATTLMVADPSVTKENVLLVRGANADLHVITMTGAWPAFRAPATPGDLQPFVRSGTLATPIVEATTPVQTAAASPAAAPAAAPAARPAIVPGITCFLLNFAALPVTTPPTS